MGVNYKGAITEYNPYVQQLPIDAYTKVGITKEEEFKSGVQRIQSTIDNIAGLDVANEGGRVYLQNRVNELTSTLNKFGYADLSDPNNIRNLQSLAAPIYQDMNIQTDVANTMQYRQLVKDQQESIKNGKAEDFSVLYEQEEKILPWLNSKNAGETYSGGSTTLKGTIEQTRKKFEDTFQKLKANKILTSSPDGGYMISDSKEYLDEDRLKRYVLTQMDAGDAELLKRSGWAKYKMLDDNMLKTAAVNIYEQLWEKENLKVQKYSKDKTLFSEGSIDWKNADDNQKYYERSRNQYGKRDANGNISGGVIGQIKSLNNLNKAEREELYKGIETTIFSDGIANAWSYEDVERKIDIDKVWETITKENGLNKRAELQNQNQLLNQAIQDNQLIYGGTDSEGRPIWVKNNDWKYVPKGTKSSSDGDGAEKDSKLKSGDNFQEIITVADANDVTTTQVNLDNIDKVTNYVQDSQMSFQGQMNEFLSQNGFEDLFTKEGNNSVQRGYDFNPNGQTNITRLVVAKGKEDLHQHILNQLTSIVKRVAAGEDVSKFPEAQPTIEYMNNDTPEAKAYKLRFKKVQLDNFLSQPALAKIVQKQTELNLVKQNWASVIRDQAIKTAMTEERRSEIANMDDDKILDYWNKDDIKKRGETGFFDPKKSTSYGSDTHPSFHGYLTTDEVKRVNAALKNISTANQNRITTALSKLQVKNSGDLVSIQNAIFNKLFKGSTEKEQLGIDPGSIQITGADINRNKDNFSDYDASLTIVYKKTAIEDEKAGFFTRKINVKDIIENNNDANVIKNLFRVAEYGSEDIAARYSAGINDNTLDKDGKPDLSKYMILTSQNKGARYFKIRYFDKNPVNAQKQSGDVAPEGKEISNVVIGKDGSTTTSYKPSSDLTGGNSFQPGMAYVEELIPIGNGNFKRVIVRKPNSDQLFDFSSYSNARLYLKDIYEDSPYWETYHEKRFTSK